MNLSFDYFSGVYDVHIRVGGHHIPKSPFRVNVSSGLDATKVVAQGPGLEPTGVIVGRPAPFEVVATDAGEVCWNFIKCQYIWSV